MSHLHYAWATLTGKVFVEDWELQDRLEEKFPNQFKIEDEEKVFTFTPEQESEAFHELAEEKVVDMVNEENFKFYEAKIDHQETVYHS